MGLGLIKSAEVRKETVLVQVKRSNPFRNHDMKNSLCLDNTIVYSSRFSPGEATLIFLLPDLFASIVREALSSQNHAFRPIKHTYIPSGDMCKSVLCAFNPRVSFYISDTISSEA